MKESVDRYLERCFAAETAPRVSELASELSASRDTVNRWALEAVGQSLSEYLKERQVARAVALLRDTRLTTTQIAYRCGFGTRRALYRAFARRMGMTPGEYRKSLTNCL